MAIKYWRGGAKAVAQVTTISFSAYTSGVEYRVTCNGKVVAFEATASTAANVFDGLVAALAAATDAEFRDFTAVNATSTLTLTGTQAGRPFTVTASTDDTPTATVTNAVAATGPNHLFEAANWVGGAAPSAGDDLVFADTAASVLYGLESTGSDYGDITVDSTFTGQIGLPATNAAGYPEYRPRFLKLGNAAAYALTIGQGRGRQSSRIQIDANGGDLTATIFGSGAGDSTYAITIINTANTSDIAISGGSVLVDATSSGGTATVRITPGATGQAQVELSERITAAGAITMSGGSLRLRGVATSLEAYDNAQAIVTGNLTTAKTGQGGSIHWESGEGITNLNLFAAGAFSFARNGAAKTVTNCTMSPGARLEDPLGVVTFTNGIDLTGCRLQDVQLDLGRERTITPS